MDKTTRNLTIRDHLPIFLTFLLFIMLPDLITWTTVPKGLVFNGSFVNLDDANVYLSAIRQGSEGSWLFTSQHTSELFPGIISFVPYLLMGKLQSLVGGDGMVWFQVLRYLAGVFAFVSLTILVKEFLPNKPQLQRTSISLLLFGSGISWLLIGASQQIPRFAADLLTPEWTFATSFMSAPHFLLGLGSQAVWFSWTHQLLQAPGWKNTLKVFSAGILLGLTYPFLVPINLFALSTHLGTEILKNRSIPWKKIFHLLAASIPLLIFFLYYGFYIPNTPELAKTLVSNNQIDPPSFGGILAGYGFLLIFSFFGIQPFARSKNGRLVIFWIVCNLIGLYLPINFSGRFVLGLVMPFCILAAEGLNTALNLLANKSGLMSRIPKPKLRRVLILITFPSTFLFLLWTITGPQTTQSFPFYYQENEMTAVRWLGEQTTPNDVVLADYPISNLIPRYSPARVFIGHLNLTIDLEEKQDLLFQFWDPGTSPSWRSEFIEQWGVTYIYFGSFESKYSNGTFTPPGDLVYDADGVKIFSLLP